MAVEPAWSIQLKQELAGLPLSEQQERLKPKMPLQMSGQGTEAPRSMVPKGALMPETANTYDKQGCNGEDPDRSTIRREVSNDEKPPSGSR